MFAIKKKWKSPPPPPPPYEGPTATVILSLVGNFEGKNLVTDGTPEVGKLEFVKGVCEAKVPVEQVANFEALCPYGFWFKVVGAQNEAPVAPKVETPVEEPEDDLLRYRELNAKLNITKEALKALVDAGKVTVTKKTQGNNELKYYSVKEVKAAMEVNHEG